MVVQEKFEGEKSFKCEECGFHFKEKDVAVTCENFCRDRGICNSNITEKALERN